MLRSRGWIGWLVVAGTLVYPYGKVAAETDSHAARKSLVTVADMISMVHIAGPFPDSQYSPAKDFAIFSPDGQHFVFAVSGGNPRKNTTDCTLLLFRTSELPHANPRRLLTFSSASNQAGISEIRWAPDGDTIYFLGSRAAQATQLYSLQLSSGQIRQLTRHSTSLESYALSGNGVIAYTAEPATAALITPSVLRHGFHVTTENLVDLVRGEISGLDSRLFATADGSSREQRLQTVGPLDSGINDLYLSPSGRYLVVKTSARNVPPA